MCIFGLSFIDIEKTLSSIDNVIAYYNVAKETENIINSDQ